MHNITSGPQLTEGRHIIMQSSRVHLCLMTSGLLLIAACAPGQTTIAVDSDGDGLSDALEDSLLQTFRPTLMVSAEDCSALPARFAPGVAMPSALHDDGTLYGQAFPRQRAPGEPQQIELHFYHLWRRDCGRIGHLLDAEHVAVLLEAAAGRRRTAQTHGRQATGTPPRMKTRCATPASWRARQRCTQPRRARGCGCRAASTRRFLTRNSAATGAVAMRACRAELYRHSPSSTWARRLIP